MGFFRVIKSPRQRHVTFSLFPLTSYFPKSRTSGFLCTTQQLDPVHLFDVIHDFLDQEAATV